MTAGPPAEAESDDGTEEVNTRILPYNATKSEDLPDSIIYTPDDILICRAPTCF
ncbi:hypothetical protein BAUCODRAFT_127417 [Baudoinia panamericana UAMH 10762]|uniref:Uncharacterized protein n=1 Tax=Baudoinia panamericana (strain UAMH 10762) TaxID=717646 RepID=M2MXB0_BAUPA|nr:uncharacterized protein BAUCODRAFT_127417 [Baudoinia panamericana UAMH 10762]EMC90890.1 hypothetical protein BAUCODRAFT_127417 [Baudoinia panamericana UAMH 10762]